LLNTYDESVRTPFWFLALIGMAAAAALFSAVGALLSDEDNRALLTAVLFLSGVLLGVVAVFFWRLRVEVRDHSLRFHFGPFGRTLEATDIRAAEAMPYRWLAFGGWGIRFGRTSGHAVRAYSVPFLRTGVIVEAVDGKRYYVSSRRPDALAAAIRRLAEPREGEV
jgi:hypothetical protein